MHAGSEEMLLFVAVPAVAGLAAALDKADADVSRLKEWQEVFKRIADDKAQEAAQELQAFKTRAAERQVAAAGAAAVHPHASASAVLCMLEQPAEQAVGWSCQQSWCTAWLL